MCIEELLATTKAIYEQEDRKNRFAAAIQGVELQEPAEPASNDITNLKGYQAAQAGFGIDQGLGYVVEE